MVHFVLMVALHLSSRRSVGFYICFVQFHSAEVHIMHTQHLIGDRRHEVYKCEQHTQSSVEALYVQNQWQHSTSKTLLSEVTF